MIVSKYCFVLKLHYFKDNSCIILIQGKHVE
jgi:hypothetical protein